MNDERNETEAQIVKQLVNELRMNYDFQYWNTAEAIADKLHDMGYDESGDPLPEYDPGRYYHPSDEMDDFDMYAAMEEMANPF